MQELAKAVGKQLIYLLSGTIAIMAIVPFLFQATVLVGTVRLFQPYICKIQ